MQAFNSIDHIIENLATYNYVADRPLATALFLALKMEKPLFLEGEAGVGKTEVAKVVASLLDTKLIRLQCYEGLDMQNALFEWNYARQILQIRLLEAAHETDQDKITKEIFGPEFLIRRPLLQAIDHQLDRAPVLLIDELDRADEEFEAFLLELLSDFQITIPEIGTIKAKYKPVVIITSNRTREIHDAVKRRCFYHWIDYPSAQRELAIVQLKLPSITSALGAQVVAFVQAAREMELYKQPGVAETLDWAAALAALGAAQLSYEAVEDTLGALLKYQDDLIKMRGDLAGGLVDRAISAANNPGIGSPPENV
ncbi:MAG: MoxR family ATPase [Candidatus Marinimicrobia bacterium]|nr:MoxR family ATPase [Candidatus Neomarinimicrobiota bacterium]